MFNQILHNAGAHSSIPTGATRATTGATPTDAATPNDAPAHYPGATACKCTHTQLDHLGALCNHLEEASACFATHPGGVYSDNLRNYNLSPEGAHKLPAPCSVTWNYSSGSSPRSNAYQWNIHFLPEDFLEVIEGLFADGRLNATRGSGIANDFEVYLAGDFDLKVHHSLDEPSSNGDRHYYELSYTPETMSSIRMFTLVEQEDLGNIRAELARYGVQLPEEEEE